MYEYPFGNGQQLNLDWFLSEWKNLLAAWEAEKNGIAGALDAEIAKAEAALADVFAARDAAAQSAANALESKNAAAQSASDASGYLNTVQQNATAAQDAARNAAQSETAAGNSASAATQSEANALQSKNAAAQSAADALADKNAAAQSATDALANKNAAAQSAADALANKNAAAQSAEDAEDAAASVEASAQQIATNTNDISDLKESIMRSAITNTVSGNPLVIEDAEQNNAIQMNAVTQDTSMNLFIGGENILDYTKFRNYGDAYGLTVSITQNGIIHITGTYSSNSNPNPQYRLLTVTDAYFRSNVNIKIFDENKENNPVPHLTEMRVQENSNVLVVILENMVYGETYDIAFSIASYIAGNNIPTSYIEPSAINISTTVIKGVIQSPIPLYKNKNYITNIGSGNIELSINYFTNTKSYIDTKDNLVKFLIAPVLDDMIADTTLTANDFRIVNNTLYRIITSVASGATLTPNTNCIATTITAVLKTLLS